MTSELLGFKYRFEGTEASAPTLLLLHGTGADENDLIPLGQALDPEANLLSPRGQVVENGMPRFFRRFAEGVLDVEDLKARTYDLVKFIEAAAAEHGFDPSGVVAVGFSNGANIAVSTLLLRPDVLRGAILLRPMVPFEPEDRPDLTSVPVFIGAGRADPLVDPADPERLARMLEDLGAEVTLSWSDGGHELQQADVQGALTWLKQHSSSLR
jgi:predicted esterase